MPIARFQMPDGRVARFEVPDGTTPEQAQTMFDDWSASQAAPSKPQAAPAPKPTPKPDEPGFLENAWEGVKTSLAGLPIGMAQTMLDAGKGTTDRAQGLGDMVQRVMMNANPARLAAAAVTAPLRREGVDKRIQQVGAQHARHSTELASKPGGLVGQVAGGLATMPLAPSGSGMLPAVMNGVLFGGLQPTANQGDRAKNVAIGGVAGAAGDVIGKQVAKAGAKAYQAVTQAVAPAKKGADVLPPETVNQVRVYLMRQGVDFDKLSTAAKQDALRTVGKALDTNVAGNADAAARQAVLNSLPKPVQATRGQLTQDYAQARNEQLLADSGSAELRNLMDSQQNVIRENVELARKGMGGTQLSKEEAGQRTREAFKRLYDAEKQKTKDLYKQADAVEGKLPVKASNDLIKFLSENAGFEGVGGVVQKAKALGVLGVDKSGALVPKHVQARKLYELRRTLSDMQVGGGTQGKLAGDAKRLVDDMFDEVGPMYKAAAAQRREQAVKYELPDVLQKIYGSTKGGLDPKVADEKLVRTLQTSSINDLRTLKKTLLLNPKAVSKREVVGLWQDLRQQMLDDITDKAVVQDGKLTKINYQTLKNNLAKVGDERLRLVLGPKAANELKQIEAAARILFKSPESKTPGSATAGNLLLRLNSVKEMLERIPMPQAARMVVGGAKAAHKAAKRELETADALRPIGDQIDKDLRRRQLELVMQSVPVATSRRLIGQMSALAGASGNDPSE